MAGLMKRRLMVRINLAAAMNCCLVLMTSCTTTERNPSSIKPLVPSPAKPIVAPNEKPAQPRIAAPSTSDQNLSVQTPSDTTPQPSITESETPKAKPADLGTCDTSVELPEEQSIFLPENKVFITKIMSPCLSMTGQRGHKKNAGWMAMGFPCSGGEGRIDWKGTNYTRPKMVSFLLETSCQMAPTDHSRLKAEATRVAKISDTAPLIAFNPFATQYWEISGYDDADTSYSIDLRSNQSLEDGWNRFLKGTPLKVLLIGRENAWVPGNKIYAVDGELHPSKKNRFTLKVISARRLSSEELQKFKVRCESLRPERSCSEVF